MNITTTTGLVGFLLALSAFNLPASEAKTLDTSANSVEPTIEQRLTRIAAIIKEQENHLSPSATTDFNPEIARGAWGNGRGRGWADGSGNRGWGNGRYGGGWGNGGGGGWLNRRNWAVTL